MARPRIRVLLIEDDKDDHLVVYDLLSDVHDRTFDLTWVKTYERALEVLGQVPFDVCLVDFRIGDRTGLELVGAAVARGCHTPMILLTGVGTEQIDLAAMRLGAAYYLEKAGLTTERLERTIRYALNQPDALPGGEATARLPEVVHASPHPAVEMPRVLLIEDDDDDYILTKDLLVDVFGASFQLDWVQSGQDALATIDEARHDVYLVDYRLGERNGLDLVRDAVDMGCKAPFIVLTGQGNREIDLEAMRAGAADYLPKGELTAPLLDRAIRYAIERNRAEQRLVELAQYDQLTGLANRYLFRDHLVKALARADRFERSVAVMLLDLDRFKSVNDTHGHEAGDLLLKQIAQRLEDAVRKSDLVARLGGDEFTVVMDGVTDVDLVARFARRILDVIKQPVSLGSYQVALSASIGIAVYPTDVSDVEELMASADTAMYHAKGDGADCYHFYTMAMRVRAAKRLELEQGLRDALARDEFELHYQPQVDLRTGQVLGVEALLRWHHPQLGLVTPETFIPLTEETGLILPIGEWVLRSACAQLRSWHDAGVPPIRVAVNFSARQFQAEQFSHLVASVLEDCALAPHHLEIEITESDILTDPDRVQALLEQFTEMGVQIALDDFGTGYSSLNHLRTFPGASIKIDQSFINNVCADANDAAIVQSVLNMAHSLELRVIAEGVETLEQLAFLQEHRCDGVQGYLICPPAPAAKLGEELINGVVLPTMTGHRLSA